MPLQLGPLVVPKFRTITSVHSLTNSHFPQVLITQMENQPNAHDPVLGRAEEIKINQLGGV